MRADPVLLAASTAFAGAAAIGSVVAIRHDLPGRPCGVSVPLPVATGVLVGWGAGVAMPWPMPVAALAAAACSRPETGGWPGRICAGLGILCIAGTLVEPVTYRPRAWRPAVGVAIAVNLAASAALVAAGLRLLRRSTPPTGPTSG